MKSEKNNPKFIISSIDHQKLNEEEADILRAAVQKIVDKRRKNFERHLNDASRIVANWPKWKQNLL